LIISPTGLISRPLSPANRRVHREASPDHADTRGILLVDVAEHAAVFDGVLVHLDRVRPRANEVPDLKRLSRLA